MAKATGKRSTGRKTGKLPSRTVKGAKARSVRGGGTVDPCFRRGSIVPCVRPGAIIPCIRNR